MIYSISYLFDIVGIVWYGPSMQTKRKYPTFSREQIHSVNQAVSMAEELVSNYFKMSSNEWLKPKYDVKTLKELGPDEIVQGPYAQIIRYQGQRKDSSLGSGSYDFYKICIQDHAILATLKRKPELALMAFCLYIVTHELIHIVRFSKFLQNFEATADEKLAEERRVHAITHQILSEVRLADLHQVLVYYEPWR
jgi:hypothetical protein